MSVMRRLIDRARKIVEAEDLDVPEVEQKPAMCGLASLKAVMAYWGTKVTQDELAKGSAWTEKHGIEPADLAEVARKRGFQAWTWQLANFGQIKHLLALKIPVIVDWFSVDEGHYSVVTGMDDKRVRLMDPELGKDRTLDLESFRRRWFDFADSTEKHTGLVRQQVVVVIPKAKP